MAAYAGVEDVLARAGSLSTAWDDTTSPGFAEIQRYLADAGAELDASFRAWGVGVPVEDPVARPALRGFNADRALLLAIDATWPGSSARDDVRDLRTAVQARVDAADAALATGDLPALMILLASSAASQSGGASDFWTEDSLAYEYGMWAERINSFWRYGTDAWGVATADGPSITKGMSL